MAKAGITFFMSGQLRLERQVPTEREKPTVFGGPALRMPTLCRPGSTTQWRSTPAKSLFEASNSSSNIPTRLPPSVENLHNTTRRRIDQHCPVVDDRVAIVRRAVLTRHLVVGHALARQGGSDHDRLGIGV